MSDSSSDGKRRNVSVSISADVRAYVAGMEMAAFRASHRMNAFVRWLHAIVPVPVWYVVKISRDGGETRVIRKLRWIYRGRVLRHA